MLNLRSERKRLGLSLDDVAERTRIPLRYLAALETGDLNVLPQGPYRQGYLRQYLDELGIQDPAAVPESADEARAEEDAPEGAPMGTLGRIHAPPPPSSEPELTDPPEARRAGDEHDSLGDEEPPYPRDPTYEPTSTTSTIPHSEEIPVVRLVVTGFLVTLAVVLVLRVGARFVTPTAEDAANVEAASEVTPQKVRVRAIEPTRVRLLAGDEVHHSGILEAGGTLDLEVAQTITVDVSDLTTVTVYHEGQRIDPLHNLSHGRRLVFIRSPVD